MSPPTPFVPALVIVDLQNDFCPPNGALPVPSGRDVIAPINKLLQLPFVLKIATLDWHPPNHISFADNHPPGNAPFTSETIIPHPENPDRIYKTTLWPVHCVQNTPGAELVSELDQSLLDGVVKKGQDPRVEMYSAFTDPFHEGQQPWDPESNSVCTSDLARTLKEKGVTDVYVVGLAMDYCVKSTAIHAVKYGYRTWVVKEGTKAVAGDDGNRDSTREMEEEGVKIVGLESDEVAWVQGSAQGADVILRCPW
ncbi:Isochorismatase hydrolase [Ascodesmis nigricans]|uniref:nicotinamidase n=1 Tax=Ascodesmis nigricans TaxID=341454 RepID=A0A4S2MUE5_9PEZI|nr:Isochorismatase hydrolase [Ascodesmis nigricans]